VPNRSSVACPIGAAADPAGRISGDAGPGRGVRSLCVALSRWGARNRCGRPTWRPVPGKPYGSIEHPKAMVQRSVATALPWADHEDPWDDMARAPSLRMGFASKKWAASCAAPRQVGCDKLHEPPAHAFGQRGSGRSTLGSDTVRSVSGHASADGRPGYPTWIGPSPKWSCPAPEMGHGRASAGRYPPIATCSSVNREGRTRNTKRPQAR
jgi:hypothetical protein